MKRRKLFILPAVITLVAVTATGVFAQENRGEGRGPGGDRGPGGFGRGGAMMGGPGRGGDPIMGLLLMKEVRDEIEILPDQEEALKKLGEQMRTGRERPDFDFRSASEEERQKFFDKMQEERAKIEKEMREKVEEVLLPEQIERLEEISIQVRGTGVLADPEIAGKLNVTDDQKAKLEEVRNASQTAMRERMQAMFSGGDRDKIREEFQKAREEMDEKILAVLTSEQRKQFDEMKGEPFTMPEGGMMGRGGPGGFGGPGGGAPGGFGRGGDRGGDRGGEGGDRPSRQPDGE